MGKYDQLAFSIHRIKKKNQLFIPQNNFFQKRIFLKEFSSYFDTGRAPLSGLLWKLHNRETGDSHEKAELGSVLECVRYYVYSYI